MKAVQEFYNKTPFPNYNLNKFNSKDDLKYSASEFAQILDESIQKDTSIIDVGTGTGQLSAFLSLRRKSVWGIDFSDSSLNKAKALKQKLKLDSLYLKKVDILDEKQIEDIGMKFDYVLCLGVLHHTEDAYKGFRNILKLLKPNGFIAIGLYNKFGRILLKIRKLLINKIFKDNKKLKEIFLKLQITDLEDEEKVRGWWNDQYKHPYETTHTIGEILRWFKKNNIEYYQTVPSLKLFDQSILSATGVWNDINKAYPYLPIRFYKQLTWIFKTHSEGGYWITFGKKKN